MGYRDRVRVLPPIIIGSDDADAIGPVIFVPRPDADTTNYTDKIYGNGGTDQICAQGGRDEVFGGSGSDLIDGGSGNDKIYGDTIDLYYKNGQFVEEYIRYEGNDSINAGEGHDYVEGDGGDDTIHGEEGNDRLKGEDGDDVVSGGDGDDKVDGGRGNDSLFGGAGDDKLYGRHGDDVLCAGAGDDYADGGAGNDLIHGDEGYDVLYGGAGYDSINGGTGDDFVSGGDGDDVVEGDDGDDTLDGNSGGDYLEGGWGDDDIAGGTGSDTLRGGEGDDTLDGSERGSEDDDGEQDYYVYDVEMESSGWDLITDFEEGYSYDGQYRDGDKIVICSQDNTGPIFKIIVDDYDGDEQHDDVLIWLGGGDKITVENAGNAFETQQYTGEPLDLSDQNALNFIFVDTHSANNDLDGDGRNGESNGDDDDPYLYLCEDRDVPECPADPVPVNFCDDYHYPSS